MSDTARYLVEWTDAEGGRGVELVEAPSALRAETSFLHASDAAGLTGRRCLRTSVTTEPNEGKHHA